MFSDMQHIRYTRDGTTELERTGVPLVYGSQEKWLLRISQDPNFLRSIQIQLPRLSFMFNGLAYDPSRKQNQLIKNISVDGRMSQYMGIPYDFSFTLSLYARQIEDGLQIIEQILPIFNPDYTMTIDLNDPIGIIKDVPIILNNVSYNEGGDTDNTDIRLVMWELSFTMKAYLFGPYAASSIIKQANTYIYDASRKFANITVLNLSTANVFGKFKDGEYVYQGNSFADATITGRVLEFDNVNRKLYITDAGMEQFQSNTLIYGLESGTTRNLSSYYIPGTAAVLSKITITPTTANANSNYTVNTDIREWPNI